MLASTNITRSMRKHPPEKTRTSAEKTLRAASANPQETEIKLPKTEGWLTREEASKLLGCSMQTLKNYENRNLLHPRHAMRNDRSGFARTMLVYSPKELSELPSRHPAPRVAMREPGERAARAFELFREGRSLDEIVIELREDPDRIDLLHERWLDQTRARYVITPEAKSAFEQIVGTFTNVTELIELITKKLTLS